LNRPFLYIILVVAAGMTILLMAFMLVTIASTVDFKKKTNIISHKYF
jgi:hypothetical protein